MQVGGSLFMRSTEKSKANYKGVRLTSVKVSGNVEMNGLFDGDISADGLQVEGSLFMRPIGQRQVSFKGVILTFAKVTGSVEMAGAVFDGDLNASVMQVGAYLAMDSAVFNAVNLQNSNIGINITMDGATFNGDLEASQARIGGSLFMRSPGRRARFGSVNLAGARISGSVEMDGSEFNGQLDASTIEVGARLSMGRSGPYAAVFQSADLSSSKITTDVIVNSATFSRNLIADSLHVGVSMYMRDTICGQHVSLKTASIGANLEVRDSVLASLDLSGASIQGDLALVRDLWRRKNGQPGGLALRNTRVAGLTDSKGAWPPAGALHLDGFSFSHLGGTDGDNGMSMRNRGMQWWDSWARRDLAYTPATYEQLATAFVATGDRSAADEVRYFSRARQQEEEKRWWPWTWSGLLRILAGFGIGDYTFRVLYWVTGITAVGGLYLWKYVPQARAHGLWWCFGASLARLLPVIEINKEFTDFFDDPNRTRLTGRQSAFFSLIGLAGWILGAFLIAAISGITEKA
jgi:uncharacterized protein YjbI with pentapeptide repeats